MSDVSDLQLVFVTGAPRSGTSVVFDLLTAHKKTAWIPQRLAASPEKLRLAANARRLHWPLLGEFFLERRSEWRSVPEPAMGDDFWKHYVPGFTPPDEDPFIPGPDQVLEEEADRLRRAVASICDTQHRGLFAAEYSGFPRYALLKKVFPQARFLRVVRDPRSVAYHMVKRVAGEHADRAIWPHCEKWTALMPDPLKQRLNELDPTPLNFCGVLVRWFHQLYEQEAEALPQGDFQEIAYSDLLSRPKPTLKKTLRFLDLPFDRRIAYYLKFHDLQKSNIRTNRNLNETEADQLARAVSSV